MPSAQFKFDGKLIEELSQKIPSTLFALNELIKNSYDAFSPCIDIKITPSDNTIIISDSGSGMGYTEINTLFHISHSSKNYGSLVEKGGITRITQGSKGLGFLAAFKFGDEVKWETSQEGVSRVFSLKKDDLILKDDLTGIRIPITTQDTHKKDGTTITIHSNKNSLDRLMKDLSDPKIAQKLAATIIDSSFEINLDIDNKRHQYSSKKIKDISSEDEKNQLFYVLYNSKDNQVEFYHKGELHSSHSFDIKRADYSIDIELVIYYFGKGKSSKMISELNRRVNDNALYPLVYINRNLFNNMTIFDPEILRKKSSEETLPQMIGRVHLYSNSLELEFNSDRTNFVENNLTLDIQEDLKELNKFIQKTGSEIKKELKESSPSNKPPVGAAKPEENFNESKKNIASILIDRNKEVNYHIPSAQIILSDFIFKAKNSEGIKINFNKISIFVDGKISENKVLASIEEECEKSILFKYEDKNTGLVSSEVNLYFKQKKATISGKQQEKSIFTIPADSDYKIELETVSDLIYAIDKAYSSKHRDEYLPLVTCSIRAIFEISSDKVFKARKSWFKKIDISKLNKGTKKEIKDSIFEKVAFIILLLKKNQRIVTKVSESTEINYSTLNNLLVLEDFKTSVKTSHVGAHQSTRYLSKPKVEECAHICGLFAVICNALINIDNHTTSSLQVEKVDENDINTYIY